ncbi:MAG: SBBP repeat-containing protein [Phycisphaerales bacterium]
MASAATILGWAFVAAGQTQQWVKQEFYAGVNALDEQTGVVYWQDTQSPFKRYVYVCGSLTVNQATGATVFATYRYEVDNPAAFHPPAFFPDPTGGTVTGTHKAAAITIHAVTGDVIVTGESDAGGNGRNYITIKYDKNLDPNPGTPTFVPWANLPLPNNFGDGVRRFDNANITNGNDQARGVAIDPEGRVYVTGSSEGFTGGVSKNYDIVTIKYDADGTLSSSWPGSDIGGHAHGVRAYNNPNANGSDTAVGLTLLYEVPQGESGGGWWCYVAGTSYNGPSNGGGTGLDFITLGYDPDAMCNAARAPRWSARHDAAGLDDVATGIAGGEWQTLSAVYTTGWSVIPDPSSLTGGGGASGAFSASGGSGAAASSGAPTNVDYATVAYTSAGATGSCGQAVAQWSPAVRYWSGPGGAYGSDDYAAAVEFAPGSALPPAHPSYLWVTGKARHGAGYEAGTILYNADLGQQLCDHRFSNQNGLESQGNDVATDPPGNIWIAGSCVQTLTGRFGTLAIRFQYAPPSTTCGVVTGWPKVYQNPAGLGVDSAARLTTTDAASGPDIFIVGTTYQTVTGQDGLTIRYSVP